MVLASPARISMPRLSACQQLVFFGASQFTSFVAEDGEPRDLLWENLETSRRSNHSTSYFVQQDPEYFDRHRPQARIRVHPQRTNCHGTCRKSEKSHGEELRERFHREGQLQHKCWLSDSIHFSRSGSL